MTKTNLIHDSVHSPFARDMDPFRLLQEQSLIHSDPSVGIIAFVLAADFFHCLCQPLILPWTVFIGEIFIESLTADTKHAAIECNFPFDPAVLCLESEKCLFILYGTTTRNGKGTTMETFLKIMGEYGKNADPSMLAMKFTAQGGGPSEKLARLAGARFVNISEPEKKITLDAGLVKRLTGNDTITARFLHENSFEFQTRFKVFVNTNHLPNITDLTLFESGRIKIIPFNRHFEEHEQDKGLKSFFALPENQSGIFNWVLEGYQMYRRERLEMPKSVLEATQEYRMESDKISQFASACLVEVKGSELRSQVIYNRYKEWCSENNYRPEGQGNFKKSFLKDHIEVRRRPKDGGEKTTLTLDVEFVKEDDDTEFSPLS